MVHYNFGKDLAMGEQAQREAVEKIKIEFSGIEIDDRHSTEKEFDFKGTHNGIELTFEVKWDIMAEQTGNVAVEYESRGKASGISVTKAKYWIYKIKSKFYLIDTNRVKKGITDKEYFRAVVGGDAGSNTKMYLIKVPIFLSWGKEI